MDFSNTSSKKVSHIPLRINGEMWPGYQEMDGSGWTVGPRSPSGQPSGTYSRASSLTTLSISLVNIWKMSR